MTSLRAHASSCGEKEEQAEQVAMRDVLTEEAMLDRGEADSSWLFGAMNARASNAKLVKNLYKKSHGLMCNFPEVGGTSFVFLKKSAGRDRQLEQLRRRWENSALGSVVHDEQEAVDEKPPGATISGISMDDDVFQNRKDKNRFFNLFRDKLNDF